MLALIRGYGIFISSKANKLKQGWKEKDMIITVDNVEIVLSQSSDKTVTIFVEMRDGQTGRVYPKDLGKSLYFKYKRNGFTSLYKSCI